MHAVRSVGAQQGWACTQMQPGQASPDDSPPHEAARQLEDSQLSRSAPAQVQQEESTIDLTAEAEPVVRQHSEPSQAQSQTGSQVLPPEAVSCSLTAAGEAQPAEAAEAVPVPSNAGDYQPGVASALPYVSSLSHILLILSMSDLQAIE